MSESPIRLVFIKVACHTDDVEDVIDALGDWFIECEYPIWCKHLGSEPYPNPPLEVVDYLEEVK